MEGSRSKRRGAFMMVAVMCMVLSGVLLASLLQFVLNQRRQLGYETQGAQAGWLLEAGIERAAHRLKSKPEYQGEVWEVPPVDLAGPYAGTVTIEVQPGTDSQTRKVRVQAKFPANAARFTQRTKLINVQVVQESKGNKL